MIVPLIMGLIIPNKIIVGKRTQRILAGLIVGGLASFATIFMGIVSYPLLVFYCHGQYDEIVCTRSFYGEDLSEAQSLCLDLYALFWPLSMYQFGLLCQTRYPLDPLSLQLITFSIVFPYNFLGGFLGAEARVITQSRFERFKKRN